ncbi:Enhancer of polycomb-like protein 1 [Dictyocoela muelleri]|nr:Enhancer of polycomb-like protein 1 [Dictyocoela muelleri]
MITRIRPKKIDRMTKYKVVSPEELNDYVDYTHIIHTGMEAEEEKEVHIKKIMTGEKLVITVPEILPARIIKYYDHNINDNYNHKDENKSLITIFCQPKELIKYDKDVENLYIPDKEDKNICDENVFRKIIHELKNKSLKDLTNEFINQKFNGDKNNDNCINDDNDDNGIDNNNNNDINNVINTEILKTSEHEIINTLKTISQKTICLFDENDLNPYLCFRKRIIKSGRKSRRNESNCVEKLKRMYDEFYILDKIIELKISLNKKKKELLKIEKKIDELIFIKAESNSLKKQNLMIDDKNSFFENNEINKKSKIYFIRKLLKRNSPKLIPFYKTCTIYDLQNNDMKIAALKRILSFSDLKINDQSIEKELKMLETIDD